MKRFVKKFMKLFLIAVIALVVLIVVLVGILFFLRGRVNLFSKSYFADEPNREEAMQQIQLKNGDGIRNLESGLLVVRFDGDDSLDAFLEQGGASTDQELLEFITSYMKTEGNLSIETTGFGCSTLQAPAVDGGYYFGRNFDWFNCDALVVESHPKNGYASISTVNTDFIHMGTRGKSFFMGNEDLVKAALYVPLDGMNEEGLCLSVNMIQDGNTIQQNTDKPDLTTTSAIRMILDKAASVSEAVELLSAYDFHASMNFMVHFAIADAKGNAVTVEYVNNEMVVTDTPVLTNFYLAKERYGIGTSQSMERYEILMEKLEEKENFSREDVRDSLEKVCKKHYDDGETTEWSIIFDQKERTATYYHREDYTKGYTILLDVN